MAINVNGTNITNVVVNGTPVSSVVVNGVTVWGATPSQVVIEQNYSRTIEHGGWYNLGAASDINGFNFTPYVGRLLTINCSGGNGIFCGFSNLPQSTGVYQDMLDPFSIPDTGTYSWIVPSGYTYFRLGSTGGNRQITIVSAIIS